MSSTPVVPAAATAPAAVAPVSKPNAIQIIEQELVKFFQQREQAVANVHAIDGAIQGAQKLLGILKAEAAKAEVEAKKLLAAAEAETKKLLADAQTEATKVEGEVKAEVVKVEGEVVTEIGKVVEFVKKEL